MTMIPSNDIADWVPTWAEYYNISSDSSLCINIKISFFNSSHASINCSPVEDLIADLSIRDVLQQMKAKPLSERLTPVRGKYDREIKPSVWVDVYDVLAAFTGKISERAKPAIDHAIKKLLAPGLRGVKEERQDLIEARDSLNRAIQQLDEWV